MVEAGGIEPPSEKDSREASTGLGWVSYLASGLAPNQGVRRPVHRKVSRVARQTQRHASPIVLHLASLSGVSRFGVPLNYYGAAFNEASGASAFHFGFNIPVETNAPPKG